jgi:hypothetical protein
MLMFTLLLTGCNNDKVINGKVIPVYGVFNEEATKDPSIVYKVSPGSVICAIVFFETLIVPVIVIGWDLYQPVRAR